MLIGARRVAAVVALALCVLAAYVMVWVVPAQAKVVHVFAGSFGGPCTGAGGACEPGQFKEPQGVAVNDTTHEAYVVDSQGNRVERFAFNTTTKAYEIVGEFNGSASPTGVFSEPTLVAVDNSGNPGLDPSAGDVYVVDSGHGVIDKFTEAGTYVGQITGARCEVEAEPPPCPKSKLLPFIKGESGVEGIAVDPKGTLWADEFEGNVYDFSDALANEYIATRRTPFGPSTTKLGVDSEDNLYLRTGRETAAKLNSAGELLVSPFGAPNDEYGIVGIAVDPAANSVYIDYDSKIEVFTEGDSQLESFGSGVLKVNGFGQGSRGVGVDASNGTVFATDVAADNVVVFDAVTLPTVIPLPPSEQTPRSVTLNGTVNPEGSPVTSCEFEYVPAGEYEPAASNPYEKGVKVPCSPGAGELVSAHLTGLKPETKYDYRLVAENKANIPSATPNQEFTAGPVLGGEFVTNVASESAMLNVPLDPNGDDTRYYFQYGPTTSYGFEAPVTAPGVDIGSTPGVQSIAVHVQSHLSPGTLYHYRLVVTQNGEEFTEPDRTFTTQRVSEGPVLPDGRGWELVSPAHNQGALIEPFGSLTITGLGTGDPIQAASDGSGIAYVAAGVVGEEPHGKTGWSQTLSVRADGRGWRSQDLTPPRGVTLAETQQSELEERDVYQVFSPDLSSALVEPVTGVPPHLSPEAPKRTIYLRDDLHGGYTPLVWSGNVAQPEELQWGRQSDEQLFFVDATPDLSHVLLSSPHAFTPEAVFEGKEYLQREQSNLYEWSAGRLQLVNILPQAEGGETTRGATPGVRLAGVAENDAAGVVPGAISSDGRRVAWDLGNPYESLSRDYQGMFVRDTVAGSTVKVSGSAGVFQWMSSNGADVFFLEGGDLHVCEIVEAEKEISCDYRDLTADHAAGEENAGVQTLVSDVSQDGSYVYFVAQGVLEEGGAVPLNAEGDAPVGGEDNLYVLHHSGIVWSTAFVATLAPADHNDWFNTRRSNGRPLPDLSHITSRVSPDGRYLAFMSNRPLTGYDNTDAASGQTDEEVFLYHAPEDPAGESGSLVCASCNPTGARPHGVFDPTVEEGATKSLLVDRSKLWGGSWLAGSVPGWDLNFVDGSRYQPRYLSDSGRLFFDSPDALVPHATNGVEDVYQYEPAGIGDCRDGALTGTVVYAASAGGCVGLISSGRSSQESAFFDASENGNDVFFVTTAKLVAADVSNSYAVFDAHVCGSEGVPCPSELASPPECSSGDSCKAAPSPQPEIFGPAPSATFSGAGNVALPPPVVTKKTVKCPRGKKLTHGKCVKPKSKKHKAKKAKRASHNRRGK